MTPQPVWLLSYPRSGNSMLASMALAAIPGCSFASIYPEDADAPRFLNEMKRLGVELAPKPTVKLIKTHHWYEPVPRKIIWLVRDGRDVMCSYWHFNQKGGFKDPVSFWKSLCDGNPTNGVGSRWDYYVACIEKMLVGRDHLAVRYEALKTTPALEMQRVADYLELPLVTEKLDLVAFEKAHAVNPTFYRQGEVGGYKHALYKVAIEYLEMELEATLRAVGY